jgi:hypothetical protein
MASKSKYQGGNGVGSYLRARIAGIEAHPAKIWVVNGKPIRKPVMLRRLKKLLSRVAKVEAITVERREALKDRQAGVLEEKKLLHDLDPAIRASVGNSAKSLAQFGMEVVKDRAPLSPEDRLIAKARAAATRDGLGTKGKLQRQAKLDELRGKPKVAVIDPKASPPPTNPPAPPQTQAPASTDAAAPARNTVVPPPADSTPLDGSSLNGAHP